MVSVTLSVPEEIRRIMKENPEVNWSALVRKSIIQKAEEISVKEKLLNKLKDEKLFMDWSIEIGRKSKKGRMKQDANHPRQ